MTHEEAGPIENRFGGGELELWYDVDSWLVHYYLDFSSGSCLFGLFHNAHLRSAVSLFPLLVSFCCFLVFKL